MFKKIKILLFISFLLRSAQGLVAENLKLHVEGNRIKDYDGRERIFHGTNVVEKKFPFVPVTDSFNPVNSFSREDAEFLAEVGFNTIRLGVLWAGFEPEYGQWNQTYIQEIQKIVNVSADNGIYPLLDMHQDVWNRKFCGEGVPDWAAQNNFNFSKSMQFPWPLSKPYDVDENNYPSEEDCVSRKWPQYHFSLAISSAVGNLYDNKHGLRDKFATFWGKVADVFSSFDNILGYELLNEPWCGNIYEDPLLLLEGVADRIKLQPLYDQVAKEIRKYDENTLIFFESVTWEVMGLGERLGFTHAPGGPQYANRSVLSFHNSVLQDKFGGEVSYEEKKMKEIQRLGIAGFLTETGIAEYKFTLTDQHHFGWMHWDYKTYSDWTWDNPGMFDQDCPYQTLEECLNLGQVISQARTYPKAVAGESLNFTFNSTSLEANLIYKPNPNCKLPTEIFVSEKYVYINGFDVEIDAQVAPYVHWTHARKNHIEITVDPSFFTQQEILKAVSLKIKQKPLISQITK